MGMCLATPATADSLPHGHCSLHAHDRPGEGGTGRCLLQFLGVQGLTVAGSRVQDLRFSDFFFPGLWAFWSEVVGFQAVGFWFLGLG